MKASEAHHSTFTQPSPPVTSPIIINYTHAFLFHSHTRDHNTGWPAPLDELASLERHPTPSSSDSRVSLTVRSRRMMSDRLTHEACNLAAGDLYVSPAARATIDATKPVKFEWNTACQLDAQLVDLYLYEPSSALIQAWQNVDYSSGSFEVQLRPKWWNSTTTAELQLSILPAGAPSWDTRSPAGPFFTVNYPESAMFTTVTQGGDVKTNTAEVAATASADGIFNDVSSTNHGGLSKGAIAAAVVVPILVVAAAVAVAIKFWRSRESEKRKRWSQAMSTHSGMEWEKGALPGERPSSNFGAAPRASMSSQQPRPMSYATSSIYAVENNTAGRGAGGFTRPAYTARSVSNDNVGSIRSSVVLPDGNVRQSRISFAENARPDRRSRLSLGGDIRPNVTAAPSMFKMPGASKSATQLELATPSKKSSYATGSALADEEEEGVNISPSQLEGPGHFSDNEMKRAGHSRRTGRRSIMSLGGGDKRRESIASALSADDFKSAASARGSVDELRDIEGMILHRRSMMSQNSGRSPRFDSAYVMPNADHVEALDNDHDHETSYDMPAQPSPIAGAQTVAYGPDQMLAVYAARGKVNSPSPSGTPAALPQASGSSAAPISQPRPTAKRLLSNLTKRGEDHHVPATTPGSGTAEMRSLIHLNNGTASSAAVDALPPPGPQGGLRPPIGRSRSTTTTVRASGASQGSAYSDDHIGSAQ